MIANAPLLDRRNVLFEDPATFSLKFTLGGFNLNYSRSHRTSSSASHNFVSVIVKQHLLFGIRVLE